MASDVDPGHSDLPEHSQLQHRHPTVVSRLCVPLAVAVRRRIPTSGEWLLNVGDPCVEREYTDCVPLTGALPSFSGQFTNAKSIYTTFML